MRVKVFMTDDTFLASEENLRYRFIPNKCYKSHQDFLDNYEDYFDDQRDAHNYPHLHYTLYEHARNDALQVMFYALRCSGDPSYFLHKMTVSNLLAVVPETSVLFNFDLLGSVFPELSYP